MLGFDSVSALPLAPIQGSQTIAMLDGIWNTIQIGAPTLVAGISPDGIASTLAIGAPTMCHVISPDGISSTLVIGEPIVASLTIDPGGIASTLAFGSPTIIAITSTVSAFEIEYTESGRAVVSWDGDPDRMAWIAVNGVIVAGSLDFAGVSARSYELSLPPLFCLEILESSADFPPTPAGYPLERFPDIHWTREAAANAYRVYRRRSAGASEERIGRIVSAGTRNLMQFRPSQTQRQDGGKWNRYRVTALNSYGGEGDSDPFPFWVPGLPRRPASIVASGSGAAPVLTLEV